MREQQDYGTDQQTLNGNHVWHDDFLEGVRQVEAASKGGNHETEKPRGPQTEDSSQCPF